MRISVMAAKGRLTEFVRRAETGDEVVLTRHGRPIVRLVAIRAERHRKSRGALLESVRAVGAAKAEYGPSAARSQDFLYRGQGLLLQ